MTATHKCFVTGGTGFIGCHLVHQLINAGHEVVMLSRRTSFDAPLGFPTGEMDYSHPQIKVVQGDLNDANSLADAMQGCTRVFHLAGYAKNWARRKKTYYDTNADGLRSVLTAAAQVGAERIVWTSTIMTLGPAISADDVITETSPGRERPTFTTYKRSKLASEEVAREFADEGLPVITVHPTRVYGPGHLTEGNSFTKVMQDYDAGKVWLLPAGEYVGNCVFVEDVARGCQFAIERGTPGESYILGGENISLCEFFKLLGEIRGKAQPQLPIGKSAVLAFSWYQQLCAQMLGAYPTVTPTWVHSMFQHWGASSAKAERDLEYAPTLLKPGLEKTWQWLENIK